MQRARILLADDHQLFVEALAHLLRVEFDVVGIAANGRALIEAAQRLKPDVIVADIAMPVLNGLDALKELKRLDPRAKVILLTQYYDPSCVSEALRWAASGYVLKHSAASELTAALHDVLRGGHYVSARIADKVVSSGIWRERTDVALPLTCREQQVVRLLAEGKSMKAAAAILDISPRTVEFHKYRVMARLGLRTSASLVEYAVRNGVLAA